jgi:putative methylase
VGINLGKNTKELTKSRLSIILSKLDSFIEPKVELEQYEIDPEIAGNVLWNAHIKGKVNLKTVADLGCGTGIIGIGALFLGAKDVYFVEIDENAIKIAKNSYLCMKSESSYKGLIKGKGLFYHKNVADFTKKVDLVVMNPPYGVKVRHADRVFLKKAMQISDLVYSFAKSESKSFIERICSANSFKIDEIIDFSWPMKQTMAFHTKKINRINVSCFIMSRER